MAAKYGWMVDRRPTRFVTNILSAAYNKQSLFSARSNMIKTLGPAKSQLLWTPNGALLKARALGFTSLGLFFVFVFRNQIIIIIIIIIISSSG